jgi:hypothetical protein
MTRAARGSGQRREQQPKQQSSSRESGPQKARESQNFFEPLPLGSDAFMAPLAPAREPRSFELRQIALWCVLGTATGGAAGALVLTFVLGQSPAASAVGRVERTATAATASTRAPDEPDVEPASVVAAPEVSSKSAPAAEPAPDATAQAQPGTAGSTASDDAAAGAPAAAADASNTDEGSRSRRAPRRSEPLIEKPSRAQVLAAMASVQPAVRSCFAGSHGTVTADMTILGRTGRVGSAQISGQTGPVGSCIARAVRRAEFPKFTAESVSIRYPMSF